MQQLPAASPRLPVDMAPSAELKRRLSRAEKKPALVLENGWHEDPDFCSGFFDRCENRAFFDAPESLDLALRAVEIAHRNSDPHLIHRAAGLLSHAHLARGDEFWAGKTLTDVGDAAVACCRPCRSDHFRRWADLKVETGKPREALEDLGHCIREAGTELSRDAWGRALFLRSIAHGLDGHRRRALDDAGRALLDLSLDSPRGYFMDTMSFIAGFLRGGGRRDDRLALEHLRRFLQRLKSVRGWTDARTRYRWVEGVVLARAGDVRGARDQLEAAGKHLLAGGLAREAVAVTLDLAQLRCRHSNPTDDNVFHARRAVDKCLQRPDLSADHRRGLEEMKEIFEETPYRAFAKLEELRRSTVAPVPGRLGERLGAE